MGSVPVEDDDLVDVQRSGAGVFEFGNQVSLFQFGF
jgi:hypothetical protein